jgi:hypothetical protein
VKDSGGYGLLVITKPITVTAATGVLALINVTQGAAGITVNAGPTDAVVLHGLTLNGHGVGMYGIKAPTFGHLTVEDTIVQEMSGVGISAGAVTATNAGTMRLLSIVRVTARDNNIGIQEDYSNYTNLSNYLDTIFSHNTKGLVTGYVYTTITRCYFENNSGAGIINDSNTILTNSYFYFNASDDFKYISSTGDNVIQEIDFSKLPSNPLPKQ